MPSGLRSFRRKMLVNPPLTAKMAVKLPEPIPQMSVRAIVLFKDMFMDWWRQIEQEDRDRYVALTTEQKPPK